MPEDRPILSSIAESVDVSRMMATVERLASEDFGGRATGTPEGVAVRDYLVARFQELGLSPAEPLGLSDYLQVFQVPADRCYLNREPQPDELVEAANVVGMIPGESEEMVILTANYDGMGRDPQSGAFFPGADYNASGVSAVLEMARVFSSSGRKPARLLVFALLDGEECGGYGSSALAEAVEARGLRESVRVINLEGLGAGGEDYMDVWDLNYRRNRETVRALEEAADLLGVTLELGGQDPGSSAGIFFLYHIPAVNCDWSWFNRDEHPDFRQVTDTPDRLNRDGLLKATRVVAAAVWVLVGG